jgi:predicted N-acyltransferase
MTANAARAPDPVIRIVGAIKEIARDEWDACANPGWGAGASGAAAARTNARQPFNPFVAWDFLQALEESGCVSQRAGWTPRHLVLEDPAGGIAAAAACYAKSHSQGEYVFDWGWADAYERAGGRYYPKLQVSVPFTPVTGPRLLARPGPAAAERKRLLALGLMEFCRRSSASSVHVTFLPEAESSLLGELGYLRRTDQQFHWSDAGYGDFEGFLAALASRKRKALRKERREALAEGVAIEWLTGRDITEAHWDAFFAFYMDTGSRKWGRPYLNRKFFSLLGERMADRVLLVMARRGGRFIAGALNLIGSDTLYGRYWGAVEHHPMLHFEVCYYQAIDYALAHRLSRVEAGAQGAHKLARGYLPHTTYSAHYIADPGLRRAIDRFLAEERREVAFQGEALGERSPFRKSGGLDPSAPPRDLDGAWRGDT